MRFRSSPLLWTLMLVPLPAAFFACDANPSFVDGDRDGDGDGDGDDGNGLGGTNGGGLGIIGGGGESPGSGSGSGGPVCEQTSAETELAPIFLAFAFDVSGSMGQFDRPRWWHDPDAKWTPVTEATTAFFEDADSAGISASMALFPQTTASCTASTYETPEVTMRALPSTAFAGVFANYEAEVDDNADGILTDPNAWRGGTPTLPAFSGTAVYLNGFRPDNADAKFAVVLVTDGLPQGCTGQNDVALVADAAEALLADEEIPTFVIGIQNPADPPGGWTTPVLPTGWANWGTCDSGPGGGATPCTPPDTLDALNSIAAAGGSEHAFLIDTDDPDATKTAFAAAINAIRTQAVSCDLEIPPHPTGGTFDKDKINVSRSLEGDTTALAYDPDCTEVNAWRYDDPDDPSHIELCPATCDDVRATPGTDLNVDFLCEVRPDVLR